MEYVDHTKQRINFKNIIYASLCLSSVRRHQLEYEKMQKMGKNYIEWSKRL